MDVTVSKVLDFRIKKRIYLFYIKKILFLADQSNIEPEKAKISLKNKSVVSS